MAEETNLFTQELTLVAYKDAQLVSLTKLPLADSEEMVLFYPVSDLKRARKCKRLLDLYTSTKNYPDKKLYVDDPIESVETSYGRWRLISNRLAKHDESPGILQTLRRGYLDKLPPTAEDDEAFLLKDAVDPSIGQRSFSIFWAGVNPDSVTTILTALKSTTSVTNPRFKKLVFDDQDQYVTVTGTFACSSAYSEASPQDGDTRVILTLTEMKTISSLADLSSMTPKKTRTNAIFEAFDIQTGEEDTFAFLYSNINPSSRAVIMALTDANLVSIATGLDATVSWTYVTREFKDQTDGTATFTMIMQAESWKTWGHDSYAADLTDYGNAGTANEKEQINKTWMKIRVADLATAISDCRTGTNVSATSGYIITEARVTDQHNGSITLQQVQLKQVNDVDVTDAEVLNPHGIFQGTTSIVTTIYDDFTAATLPAGDAIGGDVISNAATLNGNGRYNRRVVTKTNTWSKTWADKVQISQSSAGGHGLREINLVGGVSEANRAAAVTAAKTASNALTRNVLMVRLIEMANGERGIQQEEGIVYDTHTDAEAVVINLSAAVGRREASVGRIWHRRTAHAKDALTTSTGYARNNFTYEATGYTHYQCHITDHGDGAYTVYQVGIVPRDQSWWTRDTSDEILFNVSLVMLAHSTGARGAYIQMIFRKGFTSEHDAAAYFADKDTGSHWIYHVDENAKRDQYYGTISYKKIRPGNVEWKGKTADGDDSWYSYRYLYAPKEDADAIGAGGETDCADTVNSALSSRPTQPDFDT